MRSKIVFMKTKNKKASFAKIEIEANKSDVFEIEWLRECAEFKQEYNEAVQNGIRYAFDSKNNNENKFKFTILDFVELLVDTNTYAVQCAATIAAWEAMGGDVKDINIYHDEYWKVEIVL